MTVRRLSIPALVIVSLLVSAVSVRVSHGSEPPTVSYCAGYIAGYADYGRTLNLYERAEFYRKQAEFYLKQADRTTQRAKRDIEFSRGYTDLQGHVRAKNVDSLILMRFQLKDCDEYIRRALPDTRPCFAEDGEGLVFDPTRCP